MAGRALLFCITKRVPYYRKIGWRLVEAPVLIEQPRRDHRVAASRDGVPYNERFASIDKIELHSLPW